MKLFIPIEVISPHSQTLVSLELNLVKGLYII